MEISFEGGYEGEFCGFWGGVGRIGIGPEEEVFGGFGEFPTGAGYFNGGAVPCLEVDSVIVVGEGRGAEVELTGGGGCAVNFGVELADGGGEHGRGNCEAGFVGGGGEPGVEFLGMERDVAVGGELGEGLAIRREEVTEFLGEVDEPAT